MSIPSRFRKVLCEGDPEFPANPNPQIILLYGDHLTDCMHAYSMESFGAIEDQIMALDRGSDDRRLLSRLYLGQSLEAEVDKDGRVVVPKEHRDRFGLHGDVTFMGMGDYFEIWPTDRYEGDEGAFVRDQLAGKSPTYDPLIRLAQQDRG